MKKITGILTGAVVLALVAVIAVLGVKMKNKNDVELSQTPIYDSTVAEEQSYSTISYDYYTDETEETTDNGGLFSNIFEKDNTTATSETATSAVTSTTQKILDAATTVTTKVSTTVATTVDKTAFNKAFTMPKSPKYIPPDTDIDFNTASIASYKYDPDGNYYYTDDKNAWQKNFGYTKIYDKLSVVAAMYYSTVRTTFTYENKDWLVQIWKGQYGYAFVGEEIGIYTKTAGSSGSTYACADKSDWLKMEMCFIWDENKNGDYQPIFTRSYTDYWWCTGFVVGFESRASMNNTEQFRMVAHITFKNTEMAQLFAAAFEKNGFKRVSKLDNNVVDTFVQIGPDVGFVWQSISNKK
jgi:hypothetical protein